MESWKNKELTLGERTVLFMKNEMDNGVQEDKPKSYTSPRIKQYFSICTRIINGKEVPINISSGSWCAASASYALHESLLDEEAPHGFRVGVVEIVSDLTKNKLWRPIDLARSNQFTPEVGDVIIFDRSNPNDPSTAWFRHIGRIFSISGSNFECISGNAGGKYKISKHSMTDKNVLGFGEYPGLNRPKLEVIVPEPSTHIFEDLTDNFYNEYNF